jgi:hypothetical protein
MSPAEKPHFKISFRMSNDRETLPPFECYFVEKTCCCFRPDGLGLRGNGSGLGESSATILRRIWRAGLGLKPILITSLGGGLVLVNIVVGWVISVLGQGKTIAVKYHHILN